MKARDKSPVSIPENMERWVKSIKTPDGIFHMNEIGKILDLFNKLLTNCTLTEEGERILKYSPDAHLLERIPEEWAE
jgi:hypothetical protein